MATKTILFELNRAGETILKTHRLKSFTGGQFDVEMYGPDDRRLEGAIDEDSSLLTDLNKACEKAWLKYRDEVGKFMSDQEKARDKLKGDERKKFESKFGNELWGVHQDAFAKMESTANSESKKRWTKAVSADAKLKGVKFEVVVLSFITAFDFERTKDAEPEPAAASEAQAEVGMRITEVQQAIDRVVKDLKKPGDLLAGAPGLIKSVNETAAAIERDYDAGARESQKDNPDTQGDEEEPDEDALNNLIFAEHGKAISDAYIDSVSVYTAFSKSGQAAAEAVKELTPELKKLSAAAKTQQAVYPPGAKALAAHADTLSKTLREFVAIDGETRAVIKPITECEAVWQALNQKSGAALGLVAKGRLGVTPPVDRWNAAVKVLKDLNIAPRL